jgi:hypothetical protein
MYLMYSMEAEMNPKMIVIDGKTYTSVEEMPPDIRQKYEQAMRSLGDANNNQIPDVFETMDIFADKDKDNVPDVLENLTASHATMNTMKIIVDGKEFDGIENLPPEARAKYEQAMGKLDANRNGIPDFAEGMIGSMNQNAMSVSNTAVETPRRSMSFDSAQDKRLPVSPTAPNATPDTSNGWMLVLAGLFILMACVAGAGAVWYFFLR